MNRRNFVLSWGRKLFFGLSWPLTSMLAMVYLRAFILPTSTIDWIYFGLMFFGYFGMVNAIVYFAAYCPIVLMMPSYYVSRIWSLLLIIALNLFVLLDALSFANYHHHLYSFLSKLYVEKGLSYLIGSEAGLIITIIGFLILAVLIWLRGEMVWRSMQARFSNPVKNWYLGFIVIALVIAKLTYHYGDVHPKLSDVFPLDQNFSRKEITEHNDNRKFFYPTDSMNCQAKSNPNIIFIVIREWANSQITPEMTPILGHIKKHFISYNNHQNVTFNAEDGLFSLMYSIPASYKSAIGETQSGLMQELNSRKYEILNFSASDDDRTMQEFRFWIENRTGEEIRPYYLNMIFRSHAADVDKAIGEVILTLQKENLLSQTHVVVTGAYSGNEADTIPMYYAYPDRRSSEIETPTSVYDVVPTLMQRVWNCKKVFKVASVGQSLDEGERDWLLVSGNKDFKIVDYTNKNVSMIQDGVITDSSSNPRHELIFSALKTMTLFSKSR